MNFVYANKIAFSFIVSVIIGYILYIKQVASNKDLEEKKEVNDIISSSLLKTAGIAVFLYGTLYFTEENEDDVYKFIDTGDPKF